MATIYTVILKEAGVEILADVRAFPVSKRHPHFPREQLEPSLGQAGIGYEWHGKALGGYRNVPYCEHMRTVIA